MLKLFSALCLASLLALSLSIDVRVTCEACSISCSSANCYRVRGDGYDNQVCRANNPCQIGEDYTVSVERCDNNFYGNDCGRGFCYYPSNKAECASSIMGINTCQTPSWYNVDCGNCDTVTNCNRCRRTQTLFNNNIVESCIGNSCNGLNGFNVTVSTCPNNMDSYGTPCNCCFEVSGGHNQVLGICTEDSGLFESNAFTNWIRGALSEFHTLVGSLVLIASILLIQ